MNADACPNETNLATIKPNVFVARAHFDLLRAISEGAGHGLSTTPGVRPLLDAGLVDLDVGVAVMTEAGTLALAIVRPECEETALDHRKRGAKGTAAPSLPASPSPASLPVSAESTPALRARVERLRAYDPESHWIPDGKTRAKLRADLAAAETELARREACDCGAVGDPELWHPATCPAHPLRTASPLDRARFGAASAIWAALLACEALRDAERAAGNTERGDRAADDADELREIHGDMVKD